MASGWMRKDSGAITIKGGKKQLEDSGLGSIQVTRNSAKKLVNFKAKGQLNPGNNITTTLRLMGK